MSGPPYECADVFARLDDYLDRELTGAEMERVREHLEACAACAREHRFEAGILDGIKAKLRHLQAPDALVRRVTKLLDEERERGRR
jgi:anti-sigma factor (TIGR02949 family)